MKWRKILILIAFAMVLIIIILLVNLAIVKNRENLITGKTAAEIADYSSWIKVNFCPAENCSGKLVDLINSADKSIHCAFYNINIDGVIGVLAEKSKTIDVRIILDDGSKTKLTGISSIKDTNKQLMHNKFCIVDSEIVFGGSFNPTYEGDKYDNNNILILKSSHIAENYENEFDELWNGVFSGGNKVKNPVVYADGIKIENYFCPEDGCGQHIIDVIDSAEKSIYFMTYSFTHDGISDAIVKKYNLDVKGVFDKSQVSANGAYSEYDRFKGFGFNVTLDRNKYLMHNKVFIIDENIVVTGSFNPTSNGDNNNDENVMIIHNAEIAKRYTEEFGKII